jgi:hypothetical protein
MDQKIIISCAIVGALTFSGCASMSDTERRVTTGAAVGGATAGIISGSWGWAAAGAAAGATGGYLYDQSKKNEHRAYEQGVKDGQKKKQ